MNSQTVEIKITQMWRRWGTPQNFFLPFIGELEKQIIIQKNHWSGLITNNLNIYNVAFKKTKK